MEVVGCPNCLARIPCAEIYEYIRQEFVSRGLGPLPEHGQLISSLKNYGNPWMQPKSSRDRWVRKVKASTKEKSKSLYFAGCTYSLSPEIIEIPIAATKLLMMAGEDFSLLGKDELCCGSTALRLGDRMLFEELSKENKKKLAEYQQVVTSCPGCYKTMAQDYSASEESPEIFHFSQLLSKLLESGRLKPHALKVKVTYHDPCHLGRHSKVYEPPRKVIASIPELELIEMKNNREQARCCGAGAGVKTANPQISLEIAKRRIKEAEETGAEILVSACPFCEQNLKEAAASLGAKIRVLDIAELLMKACG